MPFQEGSLPVRYLGVPLISSRLLYKDCEVLSPYSTHGEKDCQLGY
ncbi:hypothetical protein HanPSC8_Chr09g0364271 [Helianthus annuus]|nr:hypothetical protein HanPSC8_Chr09g0364271 [Helianthus annuus]